MLMQDYLVELEKVYVAPAKGTNTALALAKLCYETLLEGWSQSKSSFRL